MKTHFPLLLVLAAACGSIPFEPIEDNERLGVFKFEDEPIAISVPETAEDGRPVTVSVVTLGTELCIAKGRTRVTRTGSTVVVEPIDSIPDHPAGGLCPDIIGRFDHEATVVFSEAGNVTVIVRG